MKTLLLSIICLAAVSASAQSVVIRVVANDGSLQTTNSVNIPAIHVQGLIARWGEDSHSKTNSASAALTFSQFVTQELTDKGAEWKERGGIEAIKTFMVNQGAASLTNNIPPRLAQIWGNLTQQQRTNAVNYLQQTQ